MNDDTDVLTLTDFLLARIAEDEAGARGELAMEPRTPLGVQWLDLMSRILAECEAKRRIIEQHKAWPVLVKQPPTFDRVADDPHSMTFRASQQIAWMTEQEYRTRFGTEPPTAPMIRTLASVYADHPDYDEEWRP